MTLETFLCDIRNQYDIIKILSENDTGRVILLKHKQLNKKIVLIIFKSEQKIYRFLKEISFKSLPEIYDIYELGDAFAVLEEYIDGINVAEVIESGLYSYKGAKRVLEELCDALNILHQNGYVHRDIKPENIMISSDGKVKLIDFNISREVVPNLAHDTAALGTIGYAPPEQMGIMQSTPKTDIYALGVLLNVMLTGRHPCDVLAKGKAGKIVLRCTQISPEKRFDSVIELKKAL